MTPAKDGLYAVYLRKSRADLEKEQYGRFETLAIHQQELEELARREGYALDEPYYRELVSGERIADRLEFQRLMDAVEKGRYKGILVHSITRLGRGDPMEYGWILFMLKRTGTVIVTPHKVYDPNNEDDARYLQMEMFVSNMELGNIRSRLVGGSRAAAKNGCFVKSKAPYGYDRYKRPEDGKWTLVPNGDSPTVRTIFERAAGGVPLGAIANDFNNSGMRTQSGGHWSAGRLATIISNPHYKGMIRYGYYKDESAPGDGFTVTRKRTLSKDFIMVKGLHEPLVPEDVWQAANDRNNGSAPVKRSKELKNPLAGILVCKKCGHAMIRYKNYVKTNRNEIEHYRHVPYTGCSAQGANLSVVVGVLCDALEDLASELEMQASPSQDSSRDELASVERQLSTESKRLDKLMELYFAEAISIEEFRERRAASEELARTLAVRRDELSVVKPTPREMATTVKEAVRLLQDGNVSAAVKNSALKSFIDKVEYENFTLPRSRDYDIRLHVVFKD